MNCQNKTIYTSSNEFVVPDGVTQLFVTACAAGGDGKANLVGMEGCGLAGDFVIEEVIEVEPKQHIEITVGKGNTLIGNYITLIANSFDGNFSCNKLGYITGLSATYDEKKAGNAPSGALGYGGGNGAYRYEYYSNQRECEAGVGIGLAHGKQVSLGGTGTSGGSNGKNGFLNGSGAGGEKSYSGALIDYPPGGGGAGGYGAGGGAAGGYTYGGGNTNSSGNPGQGTPGIVIIEW